MNPLLMKSLQKEKRQRRKLTKILTKYSSKPNDHFDYSSQQPVEKREKQDSSFQTQDVKSHSFDAENLQRVVDEIKVIEDGIKSIIAQRTKKVVEEKVPIKKERPVNYNKFEKILVNVGLKKQEVETYTDYEVVKKEVPRKPDEVIVTEFRSMIDKYINSLKSLNNGLRDTVIEVEGIVKNLTEVSDAFTDQIHSDRRAYHDQIQNSKDLESQLNEIIPIHDSMSPLHEKFAEIEKLRDHLEMALRDSQGMEIENIRPTSTWALNTRRR